MLQAIGAESQYNNDEKIDDQLRSVLFQVPVSSNPDCLDGPTQPSCFNGVNDLGAIDIQRGRDHGIGTYNQLRQAYGLPAKTSFTAITGEATDAFPAGTAPSTAPTSSTSPQLFDIDGNAIDLNDPDAVGQHRHPRRSGAPRWPPGSRASTARVDNIDAFTGMIAEPHVPGTEFGETAAGHLDPRVHRSCATATGSSIGNDQGLSFIKSTYGIDFRKTLGEIILANTDVDPPSSDQRVPRPRTRTSRPPRARSTTTSRNQGTTLQRVHRHQEHQQPDHRGLGARFAVGPGPDPPDRHGHQHHPSGYERTDMSLAPICFADRDHSRPGQTVMQRSPQHFDGVVNARPVNFTLNNDAARHRSRAAANVTYQ